MKTNETVPNCNVLMLDSAGKVHGIACLTVFFRRMHLGVGDDLDAVVPELPVFTMLILSKPVHGLSVTATQQANRTLITELEHTCRGHAVPCKQRIVFVRSHTRSGKTASSGTSLSIAGKALCPHDARIEHSSGSGALYLTMPITSQELPTASTARVSQC